MINQTYVLVAFSWIVTNNFKKLNNVENILGCLFWWVTVIPSIFCVRETPLPPPTEGIPSINPFPMSNCQPSSIVLRKAVCCTKGPVFKSRLRHLCQIVRTWPHQCLSGSMLKTGRWEVPGSIPCRPCRPSRSEFSVVFSATSVNTGLDTLERLPQRTLPLKAQVSQTDNWS